MDEKDIYHYKGDFTIRRNNCDSLAFWIVLGYQDGSDRG